MRLSNIIVYVEIISSNITKIKAIELTGGIKSYG